MSNLTEQAIKKTFMEMLNKKPISKITVKDISAECGLNRNSFYYHFSDLPNLIEVILTEEEERFFNEKARGDGTIFEHLSEAVEFAIQNKTAVYHIYNSANREMFEHYLSKISEKTVMDFIELATKGHDISREDRDIIVLYYKCLFFGFVIDWLGSGMKYDLRIKLKRICELFEGGIAGAVARCESK